MMTLSDIAGRLRNRAALLDRRRAVRLRFDTAVASFTFDDFPRSAYETGGRLLESAGGRGTYFAVGGYAGRTIDGVEQYDADMLKAAHAGGHEIGCHTFDHRGLSGLGVAYARRSCDENLRFLHAALGEDAKITSFAYPYGDVSPSVKAEMSRRFPLCRGVRQALNDGKTDLAQISVISLERRHAARTDLKKLVAEAAARKSWIVFLTHDVSEQPSPFGTTPGMMENALGLLAAANIPILTLKNAARRGGMI